MITQSVTSMVLDAVDLEKATGERRDGKYDDDDDDGDDRSNQDDEDEDNLSVASSSLECNNGAVVLSDAQDKSPCFQNIEVTNSSDVHFGNKTYYQGPVTIKQILYSNPPNNNNSVEGAENGDKLPIENACGVQNDGYVTDSVANGTAKNGGVNITNSHSNQWTGKSKGKKWLRNRSNKELIIGTAVLIFLVISIVAVTIILLTKYVAERDETTTSTALQEIELNKPDNDPEDLGDSITTIPKWIDRKTWLARPVESEVLPLKTPVPYVVIHHTATVQCFVLADCKSQVQNIQSFHMDSNKWSDIGYNFLIGGDGYMYEGRGWTKMGAHVKGYNNVSIGIAFIGLFEDVLPPNRSLLAAQQIIREGVEQNYIQKDYKLFGMRQLSTFKSPGKMLYELIKTWPHWSNEL